MECEYGCLLYVHEPTGIVDVAAYNLDCPVHSWRWNADPKDFPTLESQAKEDDRRKVMGVIDDAAV